MAMPDPLTIGNDNNALAESRRAQAKVWFESLRDRICAEVEALEREAPAELFPGTPATFVYKPWTRTTGSGGGTGGFLSEGRLFEKIGIHTSSHISTPTTTSPAANSRSVPNGVGPTFAPCRPSPGVNQRAS